MDKQLRALLVFIVLVGCAFAQLPVLPGVMDPQVPTGSSGHTFTHQSSLDGFKNNCTISTNTCVVTLGGTASAGQLFWIEVLGSGSTSWISSVTGETTTLCPTQSCFKSTGAGMTDQAFVASAAGGETSLTINLNANATTTWVARVAVFSYTGSGSASLDCEGTGGTGTAALTWTAPACSVSGTSDLYFLTIRASGNIFVGVGTANSITSESASGGTVTILTGTTPTFPENVTVASLSTPSSACNINNVAILNTVSANTSFQYTDASCAISTTGGSWWFGPYSYLTTNTTNGVGGVYLNASSYTAPTITLSASAATAYSIMAVK